MASSSLDRNNDITIYIKPKGNWTQNLHTLIAKSINNGQQECPLTIQFSMEGPYRHESNYFLCYNTLLLIGGGIDITPFLAIILDIFHRYELEDKDLPQHVHLIWVVQTCKDLDTLKQLSPTSIFPNLHSSNLKIIVDIYVIKGELNHGGFEETLSIYTNKLLNKNHQAPLLVLTSIGDNVWVLSLVISTTISTIITFGISQQYVLNTKKLKNLTQSFLDGSK